MKYLKIIALAGIAFLMSCDSNTSTKEMGKDISNVTSEISAEAKAEWSQTKVKAEAWQSKIDDEIAKLNEQIANSQDEVKEEAEEQREELIAWREQLQDQIDKMSKDLGEDWNDVVNETKNYFKEIKDEINS